MNKHEKMILVILLTANLSAVVIIISFILNSILQAPFSNIVGSFIGVLLGGGVVLIWNIAYYRIYKP